MKHSFMNWFFFIIILFAGYILMEFIFSLFPEKKKEEKSEENIYKERLNKLKISYLKQSRKSIIKKFLKKMHILDILAVVSWLLIIFGFFVSCFFLAMFLPRSANGLRILADFVCVFVVYVLLIPPVFIFLHDWLEEYLYGKKYYGRDKILIQLFEIETEFLVVGGYISSVFRYMEEYYIPRIDINNEKYKMSWNNESIFDVTEQTKTYLYKQLHQYILRHMKNYNINYIPELNVFCAKIIAYFDLNEVYKPKVISALDRELKYRIWKLK